MGGGAGELRLGHARASSSCARFATAGGARVVTAGSCLEYDWNYGYCSEARTPCAPHTIVRHLQARAAAADVGAAPATDRSQRAWGRIFFLYGPHEHPDRLVASVDPLAPRGRARAYVARQPGARLSLRRRCRGRVRRAARERRHRPDQHRVGPRRRAHGHRRADRRAHWPAGSDSPRRHSRRADRHAARRGRHDAAAERASLAAAAWISTRA